MCMADDGPDTGYSMGESFISESTGADLMRLYRKPDGDINRWACVLERVDTMVADGLLTKLEGDRMMAVLAKTMAEGESNA